MDAKNLIDDLIASARRLSDSGRDLAEAKLGVPPKGPRREAMLNGMGKGALVGGALAMLLGTDAGRRITGAAVKLGGLAAAGLIAYTAYQHWRGQQNEAIDGPRIPVDRPAVTPAGARDELILQAMVAAAMADGDIDSDERSRIEELLAGWGLQPDLERFIAAQAGNPTGVADLAAQADSVEAAAEIYLASRLVIDPQDPEEGRYMEELVAAIGLDPTLREELERQVAAAG